MIFEVHFIDEQCGMVCYGKWDIEADTMQEARQKFNDETHDPGYFIDKIVPKVEK
jgi:hypothetical protein